MKVRGDEYLNAFVEYQDKQNIPGYYTGGRIHPMFLVKRRPLGYLLIVFSCLYFAGVIYAFYLLGQAKSSEEIIKNVGAIILLGMFTTVCYLAGKKIISKQ